MAGRAEGKVVLISGAAQGMGASHAKVLVEEGAKVVIGDLQEEKGRETAAALGEDNALFVKLNVTSYEDWEAAVAAAKEKFGKLDVLINNAGIFSRGNVEDASIDDWKKTIDIDLNGTFYGMKAAIPALKEAGGGSIINISSIAGLVGFKNRAAYAAAKWGVQGLTKTSALDFGKDNIRVNSIHPGSVNTPLTANLKRGYGQIPLDRAAEPEEISALVLYLVSDDARFVSGGAFAIDGGETAGNNLRADG